MADSLAMIAEIVAYVATLPTTAAGDPKVENPEQLAIDVVGIVAPHYGADTDTMSQARDTYQSLAQQRGDELAGLRAEVDQLRSVVAQVIGQLNAGDTGAALAVLATV